MSVDWETKKIGNTGEENLAKGIIECIVLKKSRFNLIENIDWKRSMKSTVLTGRRTDGRTNERTLSDSCSNCTNITHRLLFIMVRHLTNYDIDRLLAFFNSSSPTLFFYPIIYEQLSLSIEIQLKLLSRLYMIKQSGIMRWKICIHLWNENLSLPLRSLSTSMSLYRLVW